MSTKKSSLFNYHYKTFHGDAFKSVNRNLDFLRSLGPKSGLLKLENNSLRPNIPSQAILLKSDKTAPKQEQAALKSEQAALKSEQAALKSEQTASKQEQAALKLEQAALKSERAVLKQERAVIKPSKPGTATLQSGEDPVKHGVAMLKSQLEPVLLKPDQSSNNMVVTNPVLLKREPQSVHSQPVSFQSEVLMRFPNENTSKRSKVKSKGDLKLDGERIAKNNSSKFKAPQSELKTEKIQNIPVARRQKLIEIIGFTRIVNLSRRLDRKMAMRFKMSKVNLNYEFFEGVDGEFESWLKKRYQLYQNDTPKRCIQSLGALGCIFSFFKCLRSMQKMKKRGHLLYLEDDVAFHNDFNNFLINKTLNYNFDLIYLGQNSARFRKLNLDKGLVRLPNNNSYGYFYGTFGFLISSHFLDFILSKYDAQYLINGNMTIDMFLNHLRCTIPNSRFYLINEPLVIPDVSDSNIRGPRNQENFNQTRGYDKVNYQYTDLHKDIVSVYHYLQNGDEIPKEKRQLTDLPNKLFHNIVYGGNKRFVFIIPSYNNERWYRKNLDSVFCQNYPLWRAIYIDDCSTDQTGKLVTEYVEENHFDNRFIIVKNTERKLQSYSRYLAYNMCKDDEICVFLDGDDWLNGPFVLTYLNTFYQEGNLQATYQNYLIYLNGKITEQKRFKDFPKKIVTNRDFRYYSWTAYHLRTCQAKFIKKIDPTDFLDTLGNFVTCCSDVIETNCYLELVDVDRHQRTDRHLLVYNKDNSVQQLNSSYSNSNLHHKYRNKILRQIRDRDKYSWRDRSEKLCLVNANDVNLIEKINKYRIEMQEFYDLLVIPFELKSYYKENLSSYKHIIELDNNSQSRSPDCRWSSRVGIEITYLVYVESELPKSFFDSTNILVNTMKIEFLFIFNGVKPHKMGFERNKNCHYFHFAKKVSVDECLVKGVSLSNGNWFVVLDPNVNVIYVEVMNVITKIVNSKDRPSVILSSYMVLDEGSRTSVRVKPTLLNGTFTDPVIMPIYRKSSFYAIHGDVESVVSLFDPLWILLALEKGEVYYVDNLFYYQCSSREFFTLRKKFGESRHAHTEYLKERADTVELLNSYYDYMNLPFKKGSICYQGKVSKKNDQ